MDRIIDRLALVKLAVFDVDGVMTDGSLTFSESGEELKTFHVQDGLGLALLREAGCRIAVISARTSTIVAKRMAELGIDHVYQGRKDKRATLNTILNELNIDSASVVYAGDDLIDLPAMKQAGIAIAVANAHPLVKQQADWVTGKPGGSGAVREICELILRAQNKLDRIHNEYLQ